MQEQQPQAIASQGPDRLDFTLFWSSLAGFVLLAILFADLSWSHNSLLFDTRCSNTGTSDGAKTLCGALRRVLADAPSVAPASHELNELVVASTSSVHEFSIASTLIQFAQVVLLSMLCYFGASRFHTTKKRHHLIIPGFMTVFYALHMRSAYVPAVLVLTVAAIFFAAEHFSTLQQVSRTLGKSAEDLGTTRVAIERLVGQEDGAVWRRRLYQELGNGDGGWSGKFRYWDIDEDFLREAKAEIDKVTIIDFSTFHTAFDIALERYEALESDTLYSSLSKAARKAEAPSSAPFGVRLIFTPPPTEFFGKHPENSPEVVRHLRNLMGLMFQVVVFNRVNASSRKALTSQLASGQMPMKDVMDRFRFAGVSIGDSTPWIHVVNDSVYEVTDWRDDVPESEVREQKAPPPQPGRFGRNLVRNITRPFGEQGRRGELSWQLARYYRSSVRADIDRGGRADAWIASSLLELFEPIDPRLTGTHLGHRVDRIRQICDGRLHDIEWFESHPSDTFASLFVLLMIGFMTTICRGSLEQMCAAANTSLAQCAKENSPLNHNREALTEPLIRAALA